MKLSDLEAEFTRLGKTDPFWAVLSNPGTEGGKWDRTEFFRTGEKDVQQSLHELAELGIGVARGKAMDFGCGVGRLTQPLAREFDEAVGVDIASSMIDIASDLASALPNCKFVVNTRDDLSQFPTSSFDFIYSHIVFQHMEPRYSLAYMREFGRLLRPGGCTAFQVLVPDGTHRLLGWAKRRVPGLLGTMRRMKTHGAPIIELYGVTQAEVAASLAQGGLEIVATRDDPNGGRGTRGLVVYARKRL